MFAFQPSFSSEEEEENKRGKMVQSVGGRELCKFTSHVPTARLVMTIAPIC